MPTQLALFDDLHPSSSEEERLCPSCGEIKPLSYFYRHAHNPDGYAYQCANCENPRRKTTGPVRRPYDPEPRKLPDKEGLKRCLSHQELKTEVIERDTCCRLCGSTSRLEVHHIEPELIEEADLNRQTCLCTRCHKRVHGAG